MEIEIPETAQYPSASTIANPGTYPLLHSPQTKQVLHALGLSPQDVETLSPSDIRLIPEQCTAFPELYVQAKLRHQNERRMRLRGLVNEKVLEVMEENNSRRMPQGEGREEGRNIDKLETMLIKENKRLRILYQQKKKSEQIDKRIQQKMQHALERKVLSESQRKLALLKKTKGRSKEGIDALNSIKMPQSKPETAHAPQDMSSSNKQNNTTTLNGSRTCRSPSLLPVPSTSDTVQNLIMRTICREDFEENRRIQSKAESFRVQTILDKHRKNQVRIKERIQMKILAGKDLERLRSKVMLLRDKVASKGGYLTLEDFTEPSKKQPTNENRVVIRMGRANKKHFCRTQGRNRTDEPSNQKKDDTDNGSRTSGPNQLVPSVPDSHKHRQQLTRSRKYTEVASWLINSEYSTIRWHLIEKFKTEFAQKLAQFGHIDSKTDFTDCDLVSFAQGALKGLEAGLTAVSSSVIY